MEKFDLEKRKGNDKQYKTLEVIPRTSLGGIDWYKALKESAIEKLLKHYNDIVVESYMNPNWITKDPKVLDGWHLALNDVEIFPNKFIDIYHIDNKENKGTFHRVLIHEK